MAAMFWASNQRAGLIPEEEVSTCAIVIRDAAPQDFWSHYKPVNV